MDAERFDLLTKAFVVVRSRRRIVPLLAGLPAAGALMGWPADMAAKRKGHHDQIGAERKKKKKHKKKCKPQPVSTTCAETCGTVLNNCKKSVTCPACQCNPACTPCQRCNTETASCEPDPNAAGDPCGDPGQICQADGSCACAGESCGLCRSCDGGVCQSDPVGIGCGGSKLCCGSPIACVDIKSDAANCGDCGQACPAAHVCHKAACEICVCASVAGCFGTVQEAVDAALDGDVIRICEGAFLGGFGAFGVPAGQTLTIIGAGSGVNPNSNTLLDGGGPMVQIAAGATVTLRDLRIMDGSAAGDGGGILNMGTLTMRDCAVSNCNATGNGGGIANAEGATLTLIDCLIEINAATFGGGIYSKGTLTVNGETIVSENSATVGGGGLANILPAVTEINNATSIRNNDAQFGGGVSNNGSLTLNNVSSVVDNTASVVAGGILNDVGGVVELNNSSSILGNNAAQGGGILNQNGTVTLNNSSQIHHNETTSDGGGLDNFGTATLNDNSAIFLNTAGGHGGGIRNLNGKSVTLNDTSSIHDNHAGSDGGGIFNEGTVARNGGSIINNDPDDCVDDGTGTGCA